MITENTGQTLCRLLAAWIHGSAWEAAQTPDFEALFQMADQHLLSAAACAAMEKTGLMADCPAETAKRFGEAKLAAIRKTLLMDAELRKILAELEEKGIWYAPLKGIIVNTVYPQYGTRQFSDNDILFDASRWQEVRELMEGRGYKAEYVGEGAHDVYSRRPVYNFEMHRKLFPEDGSSSFLSVCVAYYGNVRERMIKDADNRWGYHFSDEDFYIYFLAHAYKHYGADGTGLRTLLDVYLYRLARSGMDAAYISRELEKLGLREFEAVFRSLAEKLFDSIPCPVLTEDEKKMLDWVEGSGVYGTGAHRIRTEIYRLQGDGGPVTARTRARYLFRWFFPRWDWYKTYAPFVYRHRWTVPFFWVYRLIRGVSVRWRRSLRKAGAVCVNRHVPFVVRPGGAPTSEDGGTNRNA